LTVNDSLVALTALVDGADFAPSAESFTSFQKVCAAMNGALEGWQQLKTKELPEFRKTLDAQKASAIPEYAAIAAEANCGQ